MAALIITSQNLVTKIEENDKMVSKVRVILNGYLQVSKKVAPSLIPKISKPTKTEKQLGENASTKKINPRSSPKINSEAKDTSLFF